MGREKLTFEFVQKFFKEQNCELLETEYINAKTKMKYSCECGNEYETHWNQFQQGHRCIKCGVKKTKEKLKLSFENVYNYFTPLKI